MKTPSFFGLALLVAGFALTGATPALAGPAGTGTLTGTVTDSGGNPLPDICVRVNDSQGYLAETQTDTAGGYAVSDLPSGDSLTVQFDDCANHELATQWYDGASFQRDAAQVEVPDGGTLTGIDAQMTPGVSISGTVTDASSGAAVGDVCIHARNADSSIDRFTTTDPSGQYLEWGLPAGTYTVEFDQGCGSPGKYTTQWYDGASSESQATSITGSAGQPVGNIDAQLTANPDAPNPTVSGISPSSGPTSGGTYLTINGTDFSAQSQVWFGSEQARVTDPVTSTVLHAIAPAESAGTVDVTVTTQGVTSATTTADEFTYDPSQPAVVPSITSISPASGPTQGSNEVIINGENLGGAIRIAFGGTDSGPLEVDSNSQLTVLRVPPHNAGTVDITVFTEPNGQTAQTSADQYTYDGGVGATLPEVPLPWLLPLAGILALLLIMRSHHRHS